MSGLARRPMVWIGSGLVAQFAGAGIIAMLQVTAFVAPPSLGEASAVGMGYAVLLLASAATCVAGTVAAFLAVDTLEAMRAAVFVALAALPVVFVGVAEFYATLAMLAVL